MDLRIKERRVFVWKLSSDILDLSLRDRLLQHGDYGASMVYGLGQVHLATRGVKETPRMGIAPDR